MIFEPMSRMFHPVFRNLWFWIFVFFAIRLIGITNPPLDTAHNWRQTTVTMVARNYVELNDPFLYPRIDVAGEKSGITGMEFPLFNYLIFLVSKLFGYAHWYGRLINLIVSSIGIAYFYKLLKILFSEQRAFIASMLLLGSIWFSYSRKIMPDTFAMSLTIMGLYHSLQFILSGNFLKHLIPAIVLITLGILSKLPMACALPVLGLCFFKADYSRKNTTILFAALLPGLITVYWYYYQWVPYLNQAFGLQHFFMGKSIQVGLKELWLNLPAVLEKFYLDALHVIGFIFLIWGLIYLVKNRKKEQSTLGIFTISSIAFGGIMALSGTTFAIHSYYMIPFVPAMSLVAAVGIEQLPKTQWRYWALAVIMIENVANWQHDLFLRNNYAGFEQLETSFNKLGANRQDRVLVNAIGVPTPLYFAHKCGWSARNQDVERPEFIDSLSRKGLKWYINAKTAFGHEANIKGYPKVDSNEFYDIYRIVK